MNFNGGVSTPLGAGLADRQHPDQHRERRYADGEGHRRAGEGEHAPEEESLADVPHRSVHHGFDGGARPLSEVWNSCNPLTSSRPRSCSAERQPSGQSSPSSRLAWEGAREMMSEGREEDQRVTGMIMCDY